MPTSQHCVSFCVYLKQWTYLMVEEEPGKKTLFYNQHELYDLLSQRVDLAERHIEIRDSPAPTHWPMNVASILENWPYRTGWVHVHHVLCCLHWVRSNGTYPADCPQRSISALYPWVEYSLTSDHTRNTNHSCLRTHVYKVTKSNELKHSVICRDAMLTLAVALWYDSQSRASMTALSTVFRTTIRSYRNIRFPGTFQSKIPQPIMMKPRVRNKIGKIIWPAKNGLNRLAGGGPTNGWNITSKTCVGYFTLPSLVSCEPRQTRRLNQFAAQWLKRHRLL
jgi:hypothetical protein